MPLSLLFILAIAAALLKAAHSQPAAAATTYPDCDHTFSCGAITNTTFLHRWRPPLLMRPAGGRSHLPRRHHHRVNLRLTRPPEFALGLNTWG